MPTNTSPSRESSTSLPPAVPDHPGDVQAILAPAELEAALAVRDLTDPAAGPHAMQSVLDGIVHDLAAAWPLEPEVIRSHRVVSVYDNYDRLGFGAEDVTRDRRYTRYVSASSMLRSHTTAAIPGLLQQLDSGHRGTDRAWVLPGVVYRRDSIDRTHSAEPHQVDVWRVTSGARLGIADLDQLVDVLVRSILPGATWRSVPTVHPYTTNGLQIDVLVHDEWLELAECGVIAPHVLARCGLNPDHWSGLALGMGLDRALMLRKGIPDIRMLRSPDPRIESQMLDLEPWHPVSSQPPIRRDLSLVVPLDTDAEQLGDAARLALGGDATDLESVELLELTAAADLPEQARARLRIGPQQGNALVRLTLRPLERTLTDAEANIIRDRVYLALHQGEVLELIGGG